MHTSLVFAVDPILAGAGQIAAFIICLFVLISVLLAVAINIGLAFGASVLRDKAELIKKIRPYVDSINQETAEAVRNNELPEQSANPVARAVASMPVRVNAIDRKVEQTSDRVANAAIEFQARKEQIKMVARAFLLPGSLKPRTEPIAPTTPMVPALPATSDSTVTSQDGLEFGSPGYRQLMEEKPRVIRGRQRRANGQPKAPTPEEPVEPAAQAQVMRGTRS